MNTIEPNKIVSSLYKEFKAIPVLAENVDYSAVEKLKTKLKDVTNVVGAIEVMSKNNILKLVRMQSSLRFMAHHSFYIQFAKACEDLKV